MTNTTTTKTSVTTTWTLGDNGWSLLLKHDNGNETVLTGKTEDMGNMLNAAYDWKCSQDGATA